MLTENSTPQHIQLLNELINWATDTAQIDDIEHQVDDIDHTFRGFLESGSADDQDVRVSALVVHDHHKRIYQILSRFGKEDFQSLDLLNLNLLMQ